MVTGKHWKWLPGPPQVKNHALRGRKPVALGPTLWRGWIGIQTLLSSLPFFTLMLCAFPSPTLHVLTVAWWEPVI